MQAPFVYVYVIDVETTLHQLACVRGWRDTAPSKSTRGLLLLGPEATMVCDGVGMSTADGAPWTCRHIRLSNPAGPGDPDVPRLLRAVADLLERIGDDIEVLDLGLRQDDHRDGPWTAMNIYYRRGQPRPPRPEYWG